MTQKNDVSYDNQIILHENEKEANQYAARCLRVMALVVACIWGMNLLGLFVVPDTIMAVAAGGAIILFLLPMFIPRFMGNHFERIKIYTMACCILGTTLLSAALPKHAILAWPAPLALSCHYYSRRFTVGTLLASIVCMAASLLVGVYVGEWDSNLLGAIEKDALVRVVDAHTLRRVILYYTLPRCMVLVGISNVCASLADRTHKLLERQIEDSMEKQRIASELNVATQIQTSMLPCLFPAFPGRKEFDIFASMSPAKEVGGDFYDFFMVDEHHLAIVMADVSGKGVPAALFMVIGKTLIKDHTLPTQDLGQVFTRVNDLLCESNSEGLFITAFEGVLDLRTGEFNFVNAGHEMPFISHGGAGFEPYKIKPGFVLAGMEGMNYRAGTMTLNVGDKLFQYTDGVTEATNANNELYGMERLGAVLKQHSASRPEQILEEVRADIDRFVGDAPQFDDITMLCLEYKGRSA